MVFLLVSAQTGTISVCAFFVRTGELPAGCDWRTLIMRGGKSGGYLNAAPPQRRYDIPATRPPQPAALGTAL
jgi:hypothetical protein